METSAQDQRRRRESTAVIGALWTLGATLTLLSAGPVPGFDDMPHRWLVLTVAWSALVLGLAILAAARHRGGMDRPLQEAAVATASVAIAVVVVGGGPAVAIAYGSLLCFVAAASFLAFPFRRAVGQLVFGSLTYLIALSQIGWPGGAAAWMYVIGVSIGGAALFGHLGARAEDLAAQQSAVTKDLQRLERTRQTFLQAVSHELRTPLTTVLGFSTLLDRRGDELTPEVTKLLHGRLHAQATRLDVLLTDLLDVERLTRGGVRAIREPVDADFVVRSAIRLVEVKPLLVVNEVPAVMIDVEPAKLERIVVNLVANARKHATGATTIWIEGWIEEDDFILVVSDDGPGVPVVERDAVLEPFRQGQHTEGLPSPGTGLGLAIVNQFAEIHGGDVRVGERPGGGGQFRVRLADARLAATTIQAGTPARTSTQVGTGRAD